MYEVFFGFSRRPFSSAARLEDYFPSASMEQARQTVRQCLERAAGWAMVVGGAGMGKTILCLRLAQELEKTFPILLLSGGGLSGRRELWQTFLYALGQPYRGMEEGELRLALLEYLAEQQKHSPGFILLLDEAHLLPGKLLEEIRLLSQMPVLSGDWFRVLLAGGPVLEERVSSPRLEGVHQRIVARSYLEPWTRTETCAYIRTQLQKASPEGDRLMLPEAAEAVFQATNGIPRLVNQLCDHALFWAWQHGLQQVDARMVEEAWAELQQLPPPSVGVGTPAAPSDLIEFGVLQDEPLPQVAGDVQTQGQTSTPVAHAEPSVQQVWLGTAAAAPGALAKAVAEDLSRTEHDCPAKGTIGFRGSSPPSAELLGADLSEAEPNSIQTALPESTPPKADPPDGLLPQNTFTRPNLPEDNLSPNTLPQSTLAENLSSKASLPEATFPQGVPPDGLLSAEGPSEELPGDRPEHEFFFALGEGAISEDASAYQPQQPDTPEEALNQKYHLEAWDRLQQIEEALSEMADPRAGIPPTGNQEPEVELLFGRSQTPGAGSETAGSEFAGLNFPQTYSRLQPSCSEAASLGPAGSELAGSEPLRLSAFGPKSAVSPSADSSSAISEAADSGPAGSELAGSEPLRLSAFGPKSAVSPSADSSSAISEAADSGPAGSELAGSEPLRLSAFGPKSAVSPSADSSSAISEAADSGPAGSGGSGSVFSDSKLAGVGTTGLESARLESSCSEKPSMENNPFAESFLEEQWIEDPYLQLDMEGHRPWASPGWLGHAPAGSDQAGKRTFSAARLPGGVQTTGLTGAASPPKPAEPPPAGETLSTRRVLPLHSAGGVEAGGWTGLPPDACSPEPPIIVIEEEVIEGPVLEQKAMATPVSRHEYRRLFARLRRG